MVLKFTRQQEQIIRSAYSSVAALVERDHRQERRLKACLKAEMKHFGPVAGRVHLLNEVRRGIRNDQPWQTVLANLSGESDERIMAYMVGVYIESKGDVTGKLIEDLQNVQVVYTEAQRAYLDSI